MSHHFHASILREYDVRGIVGDTLTEADAYALGRSYAALATEEGARRIAVGRDGRTHSPELEAALIDGLTEGGLDVVRIGMGPSPMLYFATDTLGVDGGIQVTGSHNPADYNGFKLLLNGRSVFGEEIQALGAALRRRRVERRRRQGRGSRRRSRPMSTGWSRTSRAARFRIGWDAGNGAAGPALEKLVQRLPGEHHAIFTEVDGAFPNHHPDPTVEANLADLKRLVADKELDFGIAFDGDGDRIGAVDGQGRVIWGDQLLVILAGPVLEGASRRDHHRRRQGEPDPVRPDRRARRHAADVEDRPQPDQVEDEGDRRAARRRDERPHLLQAPLVRLRRRALRRGAADRGGRASGKSLTEIMDAMPKSVATPEMRFPVDEPRKFAVVEEVLAACPPTARRSTRPTARGSTPPTAGGCCAHRTRRTCWSPGPRPGTKPASSGWSRRSTSSWRSPGWSATKRPTEEPLRSSIPCPFPGSLNFRPWPSQ